MSEGSRIGRQRSLPRAAAVRHHIEHRGRSARVFDPMRGNEQDEMRSVAQTIDGSSRFSWFPIAIRG